MALTGEKPPGGETRRPGRGVFIRILGLSSAVTAPGKRTPFDSALKAGSEGEEDSEPRQSRESKGARRWRRCAWAQAGSALSRAEGGLSQAAFRWAQTPVT